jgi:hypothetical protein
VVEAGRRGWEEAEGISGGRGFGGDSEVAILLRMEEYVRTSVSLRWQIIAEGRGYARSIRCVAAAASGKRALPLQETGGRPSWRMMDGWMLWQGRYVAMDYYSRCYMKAQSGDSWDGVRLPCERRR